MMFYGSRSIAAGSALQMSSITRPALAALAALTVALPAATADAAARISASGPQMAFEPGEVVVTYEDGRTRVRRTRRDETTLQAVQRLRRQAGVRDANPNWIARAAGYIPNDPGRIGQPGGWQRVQWNLLPGIGVDAPTAWENLIKVGRPGGLGVVVAVLDTGVAYSNRDHFYRSPDFRPEQFRQGYDFVGRDPYANDVNGHGTHVASTIAEAADNGIALVGLAYGARIMPVRVLDRLGEGDSVTIARGIRFAARRGAKVINLSFEFGRGVTARHIPNILRALRYARRRGALVVGASGNARARAVAYPARSSYVLSVGATTEHGCQAEYSNAGSGIDLVAPGGGGDADIGDEICRADEPPGRDIIQMTLIGRSLRRFGLPGGYMGTSMAAPHVSATAALVVASGVLGEDPSPRALEAHLKVTADDLGRKGPDPRYGHGRVNAGRATTPLPPEPPPSETPPAEQPPPA